MLEGWEVRNHVKKLVELFFNKSELPYDVEVESVLHNFWDYYMDDLYELLIGILFSLVEDREYFNQLFSIHSERYLIKINYKDEAIKCQVTINKK